MAAHLGPWDPWKMQLERVKKNQIRLCILTVRIETE